MEYLCDEELEKFKVPQLKQYLSKHGQVGGGKKAVLLERAKGIAILKVKPVECLKQQDYNYDCVRREEKLVMPLGEVIPDPTLLKGWSSDLSSIPNFSETDIYNYLVLARKAKRQLKSKVFYKDRHVHDVQVHPVNDTCTHCLVKCKVIPSLPSGNKKENPDYTIWTCLAKVSGNVLSANCNCTAGLGEACNHIGALLYALVDITDKKEDGLLACISLKCSWNNPRKRRLSPKKAVDIFRGKESYPRDQGSDFHSTVDENRFRKRLLEKNSKAGWLTNFTTERNKVTLPQLDSVTFMYSDQSDLRSVDIVSQFQQHFALINVTDEQCAEIESVTRGQATNASWAYY
ncbi:uncharacterized protein LOC110463357 [Mizuhopecten yessoensis]|uniref:uncharacterized protein LOC110463357 n=1 Tax=Mizuhopecten yessoensis TaxID=6573 RepID=UPI000B45A669|nr:uncharacterized protein LOC110463357 [Mizuhopecten yessoensis]